VVVEEQQTLVVEVEPRTFLRIRRWFSLYMD
jgi:hypothetical protein